MAIFYILLFASALIFSLQFLVTRQYQRINGTGFLGAVRLSFMAYLTIAIFFFVKGCITMGGLNFGFSWFTLLMTLGISIVSLSCVYMGIKVLSFGDMSVYSVFMMLGSLILPSLVGLVFYGEELTLLKAIAILLMFSAIIFSVSSIDKSKINLKAILFYIGIFVMNGMIGVFMTIHQNQPELTAAVIKVGESFEINNDVFMTWYGLSTVMLTAVIYAVVTIYQKIKKINAPLFEESVITAYDKTPNTDATETSVTENATETESVALPTKSNKGKIVLKLLLLSALFAAGYGICNGLGDYFIALSTQPGALGSSVTFPIINGGTILFSSLFGVFLYKEKMTVYTVISLVLVIASTVLFMFV